MRPFNVTYFAIFIIITTTTVNAAAIKVKIVNKTQQLITQLDFWLGSSTEANGANLNYSSKGTLPKDSDILIPVNFRSKKSNTFLVKGYLTGGGYVSQKYTISIGETNPVITLYNIAAPVKTQEFSDVMNKFSALKITNGENLSSRENALDAIIGAAYIYSDSTLKNIIYKLTPPVLKTRSKKVDLPTLSRKISGIFSNETAINGNLTLPYVSTSTAFQSGDVAKFTWEIEDIGEYNWFSEDGTDLATLFSKLSNETKKVLIDLYEKNPNAKVRFIDKAFVIGRMQITTSKTKKVSMNTEINGANFVTASGNYSFVDDLQDAFVLKNVITQIDGYDATILLTSLYLDHKTQNASALSLAENERVKTEYQYLLSLYRDKLVATTDVTIMKKALSDLSKEQGTNLMFLKKTLKDEQIDVKTIE